MPKERIYIQGKGSFTEVERGKVYRFRWRLPPEKPGGKLRWSPMRTVHCRKAEAEELMLEYKKELEDELNASGYTVGQYARLFQDLRIKRNASAAERDALSPLTIERDEIETRRIESLFGDVPLEKLTAGDIMDVYDRLRSGEAGLREHGREVSLSESSIHKLNVKLRQVLEDAYAKELIDRNPCDRVKNAKKPKGRERKALTLEQAVRLAQTLKSQQRTGRIVAVWLALALGLRRGEALGLVWGYVDLEGGGVRIAKQLDSRKQWRDPKTDAGIRDLDLDAGTVAFLTEWKALQSEMYFSGGDVPDSTPVCTAETSPDFIEPASFDRWRRKKFVEWGLGEFTQSTDRKDANSEREAAGKRKRWGTAQKGYRGFNLHELRHTQATLLVGSNEINLKGVQDRMGHTDFETTSRYTHRVRENEARIAEWVNDNITGVEASERR